MAVLQVAEGAQRVILDFKAVYPMKLPGVHAFHARYTKNYAYTATASRSIGFPDAAIQSMFVKRWQTRQDPLWWSVAARKDFEAKRTVRSWVSRRVRQAFVESLRKKGYAQDGSRIGGWGEPLVGTLQLYPERPIMKTKFADLGWQTDSVVQAIINRQQNPYKGTKSVLRDKKKKLFGKYTKPLKPVEIPSPRPVSRRLKL